MSNAVSFWKLAPGEEPLAKPDQTYGEHVTGVLKAHSELWEQTASYWRYLSGLLIRNDLSEESQERLLKRVEAGLKLACATHDIGKLNEGFHHYMKAVRAAKDGQRVKIDPDWHFRHELLSLPFTFSMGQCITKETCGLPLNLAWETVAVMGHHKPLNRDLFEREAIRRFKPLSQTSAGMLTPELLAQFSWVDIFSQPSENVIESFEWPEVYWRSWATAIQKGRSAEFIRLRDQATAAIAEGPIERRLLLRCFAASFRAHLQICDWWASAGRHGVYGLGISAASPFQPDDEPALWLKEAVVKAKKQTKQNKVKIEWRPFQQQVAEAGIHAYCIAPTGSGKTEAALLWALNHIRKDPHISKIVYLLPTTTTANAIHARLAALFGPDLVGLNHGKTRLLREAEADACTESEEDRSDVRRDLLFDSAFFRPVTVATLDQLLLSGLHGKHWFFKNHSLAQAVVILDELHAFDPYALGLLGAMARQLGLLQTPVLALSATFPKPLVDVFSAWHPDTAAVQDTSLLSEARAEWDYRSGLDFEDEEYLAELAACMRAGERMLLVRNTVRGAQETFVRLRDLGAPVRLLHSSFIQEDRAAIETAVLQAETNGDKTSLISTQIVEVSLDIDFDHLVSELCPPDSLVQRAGRCNRARKKSAATVTVLNPDKASRKVYEEKFGVTGILEKTGATLAQRLVHPKRMTEQELLDWVNEVYSTTGLAEHEKYIEGWRELNEQQRRLSYMLDHVVDDGRLQTRWVKDERVPVIPEPVWSDLSNDQKEAVFSKPIVRSRYSVEISFWRRQQLQRRNLAFPLEYEGSRLECLYLVEIPYDKVIGLTFPKDDLESRLHVEIF